MHLAMAKPRTGALQAGGLHRCTASGTRQILLPTLVVVCLRKESALLYSVGASVFGTGHHLQTYVSVRISYAGGTYRHLTSWLQRCYTADVRHAYDIRTYCVHVP